MKKQVLFIQGGGGESDYQADLKLVSSLQENLGGGYILHYPLFNDDDVLPDYGRVKQIEAEIHKLKGDIIVVAHSLGASMLLKCLSERVIKKNMVGIFLISTPFWSGNENWVQGLKLQNGFNNRLSRTTPLFFYHCRDDEEVPFTHLKYYKQHLPWATICELTSGGHQLNNDLSLVAMDIKSL